VALALPDRERLQRVAAVGDDHGPSARSADERETGDVEGSQKATLRRRHWGEVALAITSQPKPVASVGPRRVRFSVLDRVYAKRLRLAGYPRLRNQLEM